MKHCGLIRLICLCATVGLLICQIVLIQSVSGLLQTKPNSQLITGKTNRNSAIKTIVDRNQIKTNDHDGYLDDDDEDSFEFDDIDDANKSDSWQESHHDGQLPANKAAKNRKSKNNGPKESPKLRTKNRNKLPKSKHWEKDRVYSKHSDDIVINNNDDSAKKTRPMWPHELDKYFTSSEICNNIRCDSNEYCLVPKPGVAECVRKTINLHNTGFNKFENFQPRSTLINLDDSNEDIKTDNDDGGDDEEERNSNKKYKPRTYDDENNDEDDDDDDSTEFTDNDDNSKHSTNDINYEHKNNWIDKERSKWPKKYELKPKAIETKSSVNNEEFEEYNDDGDEEDNDDGNDDEDSETENFVWSNKSKSKQNTKKSNGKNVSNSSTLPNDGNQLETANRLKFSEQSQQYNSSKIIQCPSCPFGKGQLICGTDNATYSSMCRLEFHNCIHRSNVKFACFGFCPCMKVFQKVLIKPIKGKSQQPQSSTTVNHNSKSESVSLKSQYYNTKSPNVETKEKMKIKVKNGVHNSVLSKKALSKYHYTVHVTGQKPIDSRTSTGFRSKLSLHQNKTHSNPISKQLCSNEQLRSMGLRLLDWFMVVMNEELKRKKFQMAVDKTQRKSNLSHDSVSKSRDNSLEQLLKRKYLPDCEEQVSFMFYHFDTNQDFKLSAKELYYLEHDENEHCLEPYLTQCDEDGDEYLSAYEWCSCFSLKSKPCLYHMKHLNNGGLLGGYVPQCTDKGHYQKVQCQASTNYCWCSDKNGNEIAGTRVRGRQPLCDKTYPLNRNKFYKNKYMSNEPKENVKIEQNKKPYHQSDINEDMEDGDDDEDTFNLDQGSGFNAF